MGYNFQRVYKEKREKNTVEHGNATVLNVVKSFSCSVHRRKKQQQRIFGSRVAFRIVACVRWIDSSGCDDDEWHFLFESSTWRQPHILRTFIIYFASIRQSP